MGHGTGDPAVEFKNLRIVPGSSGRLSDFRLKIKPGACASCGYIMRLHFYPYRWQVLE